MLYDENDSLRHSIEQRIDKMCVMVMALCNQLVAFALDLGDD